MVPTILVSLALRWMRYSAILLFLCALCLAAAPLLSFSEKNATETPRPSPAPTAAGRGLLCGLLLAVEIGMNSSKQAMEEWTVALLVKNTSR